MTTNGLHAPTPSSTTCSPSIHSPTLLSTHLPVHPAIRGPICSSIHMHPYPSIHPYLPFYTSQLIYPSTTDTQPSSCPVYTHSSVCLLTCPSVHISTYPIHPFIHPGTYPSTYTYLSAPTHPSIHPSIQTSTHSSIHPSTHSSTHPPIHFLTITTSTYNHLLSHQSLHSPPFMHLYGLNNSFFTHPPINPFTHHPLCNLFIHTFTHLFNLHSVYTSIYPFICPSIHIYICPYTKDLYSNLSIHLSTNSPL